VSNFHEETRHVPAADGQSLHCRLWVPADRPVLGRILVLHGIQSHAGWYESLGRTLASRGIETAMPDRRGSGSNAHDRGHAHSPGQLLNDIDSICRNWREMANDANFRPFLGGISWGGKLAIAAAATRPNDWAGLALIAPGLFARVRPPFPTQLKIAVSSLISPRRQFPIPLADPALFTADPQWQNFIATDPATLHDASARFFVSSRILDLRLKRYAKRISCPVLLQLASEDRIIDNGRTRDYVRRLPSGNHQILEYLDAHHTLEFEPVDVARRYAEDLAAWIRKNSVTSAE
jgi:alpha-beta hydrolase superfamily lysophospholipase